MNVQIFEFESVKPKLSDIWSDFCLFDFDLTLKVKYKHTKSWNAVLEGDTYAVAGDRLA